MSDSNKSSTVAHESSPPQPVHIIELKSTDSTISDVHVCSNRAVITRTFIFNVKKGQNQLNISGLPKVLDKNSLRVEGPSTATFYGATISIIVPARGPTISGPLEKLNSDKKSAEKDCERAKKSLPPLETYLGFLKTKNLDAETLREAVRDYGKAAKDLDSEIVELDNKLTRINEAISTEKTNLSGPAVDAKLNLKASIGLFSDDEGRIRIKLIYAADNATWKAEYDICADSSDANSVILTYKGGISQDTGEDWVDVSITLETDTPAIYLELPTLSPWNLGVAISRQPQKSATMSSVPSSAKPGKAPFAIRSKRHTQNESSNHSATEKNYPDAVPSRGNVGAHFVTDSITIGSGGIMHIVTIVKLKLNTTKSLVCVPKKDTKTYLIARIENTSKYTFLKGHANIYVDNNFVSKSDIQRVVNPEESFDCPLGVDPSIRVIYHPCTKNVFQSGIYTKTTNHVFSQHITIFNNKTLPIEGLKIIDQIPVPSEDSDITVKLISPALRVPGESLNRGSIYSRISSSGRKSSALSPLKVDSRVTAQWYCMDEAGMEVEVIDLGRNGKLNWVCNVPAWDNIVLFLQWKMKVPVNGNIMR